MTHLHYIIKKNFLYVVVWNFLKKNLLKGKIVIDTREQKLFIDFKINKIKKQINNLNNKKKDLLKEVEELKEEKRKLK